MLKQIVEAALLAAGRPLNLEQLQALFVTQGRDSSYNPSAFPPPMDGQVSQGQDDQERPPSLEVRDASVAAGAPPEMEVVGSSLEEGRPRAPKATAEEGLPDKKQLREALQELTDEYMGRGIEIVEVGNGFRIQVRSQYASWVSRLYTERPPKYSRALLETLALIAYRQPITRGEIEDIRGVSVSTNIVKTLTEREWVRVVGHRDVPGKPALYATTREFLDYFNLKGLSELPSLAEIRDLESINRELELKDPDVYEPEDQDAAETPETDPEVEQSDETEPATKNDAAHGQVSEPELLIEADPDGETDSGVMHQSTEPEEVGGVAALEDPIDFDPDGETDSITDSAENSDQQVKRPDETE